MYRFCYSLCGGALHGLVPHEDSDSPANLGPSGRRGRAAPPRTPFSRPRDRGGRAGGLGFISHTGRASFVSRARQAKPVTRPKGSRARSAKSCALRGDNRRRPANAGRSAVRPSRESKIRSPLSLWPPVTWDHGLRLWLMCGGLESSVPLVLLLVGEKPWAVRPSSHIVRSARPRGERYPRTKSEDDAVGAPRLVFGR